MIKLNNFIYILLIIKLIKMIFVNYIKETHNYLLKKYNLQKMINQSIYLIYLFKKKIYNKTNFLMKRQNSQNNY